MRKIIAAAVVALCVLAGGPRFAFADIASALTAVCQSVDCLNNFTAKTGYSFRKDMEGTGGFTDLEQNWYLSPAPGFNFLGNGFTQKPAFDGNLVFKFGNLLSDKIPSVHAFVNSQPFLQGLMKYTVAGFSWSNDFAGSGWYDMEWLGATVKF